MTTTNERVLSAIADGETTVAGICSNTGLEPNQVHQAAFLLKKAGSIIKGDDGYELADGVTAPEPAADPPPVATKRKYTKRATKARKTPKVKRTPKKRAGKQPALQANGHAGNGVANAVEFAKFGDFVVLKRTDVVDLLRTMQRWSDMVERML